MEHENNKKATDRWLLTIDGPNIPSICITQAEIPTRISADTDFGSCWNQYNIGFVDTFDTDVITELENARKIGTYSELNWNAKLSLLDPVGAIANTWEFTLLNLVDLSYGAISFENGYSIALPILAKFNIVNVRYTPDNRKSQTQQ